ncbi:histidine triad (HIT) protein [Desulfovibrio sp. X2]|uniref:HIT family protein n=1 Tax=Desulfovibrio sp. X2 TaxID=941449 RepID=UPI000358ACAA|nr:HIT family protein [Desulfovibrio sp. X2]EPR43989.1 histidine triad (HIT) protein [Desulfovibrio sp. X2]
MDHSECIFCKIARGEIPCAKIYETQNILSFLDISPSAPGHALIIPKAHFPTVLEVDPALGPDLITAFGKVGRAVMAATGATGMNVMLNCNESAGQVVFHTHWHVIPRIEGDGLRLWPGGKYDSMQEMSALAEKIRALVA